MLPALLALLAAVADSQGTHGLARDALFCAVPFAAVAALESFGGYLDARGEAMLGLQSLLWAIAVFLLVLSCGVRSGSMSVPPIAVTAVFACLGVFAIKAVLAAAPHARRLAGLRPAKP